MGGSGSIPFPGTLRRAGRRGHVSALLAALVGLAPLVAAAEPSGRAPLRLTVAYSMKAFTDVDTSDARAAARLWGEQLIKSEQPGSEVRTELFESLDELEPRIQSGAVDVIGLDAEEYLALRSRSLLEPVFVSESEDGPFAQALLVVRKDLSAGSLAALKGKRLDVTRSRQQTWHRIWLDTLLMKEGHPEADRFFSSSRVVGKPSQALLRVFFGQSDACVVSRGAYRIAVELNPQIGQTLTPFAASPQVLSSVIAFRSGLDPGTRASLRRVILALDSEPEGRQILTLFQQRRLVPFRPEYLQSMSALLAEHRALIERRATRRERAR